MFTGLEYCCWLFFRISAMAQRGLIPQSSCDEIGVGYDFFPNLGPYRQFLAIVAGSQPLNPLRPGSKDFSWRTANIVGGVLGLGLFCLRLGTFESGLFEAGKAGPAVRGDLRMLLRPRARLLRSIKVILTGVPIWFSVGILVVFASEFTKELHVQGEISGGQAVFWAYLGLAIGDLAAGLVSQALRSRRRALILFLLLDALAMAAYLSAYRASVSVFEGLLFAIGLANGYWAVFATTAAEQFGTNLRATVATTAPNFVRGSLMVIEPLYKLLREAHGRIGAAALVGAVCLVVALAAT